MDGEDQRLIGRLRDGDHGGLEGLFERHSRAIYAFLVRATDSFALSEDLTQEVFLRVLRYHASYRPDRSFRVWLYAIARNVLADHRSRRGEATSLDALKSEPPSRDAPPPEILERDETRARVRAALGRLGDGDRELLVLSRFHDMRHAELAELFGCSIGAIKVRVHRALKRLAAALEALDPEVTR
jgi:RNA polymerase sigma-70 factor (ECF subfamily)